MCSTIAWAITSFPCGRRKVHWSWPGGRPTGEADICTVLVSAATGAMAAATGVRHEPRTMSTLSSVTRRRMLLTPLPGSLASSSTMRLTFSPAISLGNSCICFCIGRPRPDPGPVSDSTTPTLMSARAAPLAASATAAAMRVRVSFMQCLLLGCRFGSARRHPQRAIQADHLAIQVGVGDDMAGELGELFGFAQARRERDGGGQRLLHRLGQLLHQ